MDPVTGLVAGQAIQALTKSLTSDNKTKSTESSSDFEAQLKSLLSPDSANNVNEEELYAGLIQQQIQELKGDDAASEYASLLSSSKSELTTASGYVPVEAAGNSALAAMVESGTLTEEEAMKIKSSSFKAAQLDDNLNALYDGRGSAEDPTIAVMGLEEALTKAKAKLADIAAGNDTSPDPTSTEGLTNSEDFTPTGEVFDGSGGFLYKPESDHGGNLVVVAPSTLAQQIQAVVLKDAEGNVIEQGNSSGYGNPDANGEREHFRFGKPGSSYPENLVVEITLSSGAVQRYTIPDPSKRYD